MQIIACCSQAPSHYLNQCWPRSTMPPAGCHTVNLGNNGFTLPVCHHCHMRSVFTSVLSTFNLTSSLLSFQWNLICGYEFISSLITTIQMVGVLLGAFATGQLADTYGRRKIIFLVYSLLLAFGFASSFSNSWQLYAFFRFLIGAFFGGGYGGPTEFYQYWYM